MELFGVGVRCGGGVDLCDQGSWETEEVGEPHGPSEENRAHGALLEETMGEVKVALSLFGRSAGVPRPGGLV